MNYSLSSSRKIGGYTQKIITTYNDAAPAPALTFFETLKSWHEPFAGFDYSTSTVGTIEWKSFTRQNSKGNTNLGGLADITFTVLSTSTAYPKLTTIKVENVSKGNIVSELNTAFASLIGSDIKSPNNYLVSAILNLH